MNSVLQSRIDRVYTTGQVAKICSVAPRTVTKWCDDGLLKHYKIPGSVDRRIVHANLVAFMAKHKMPMAMLEGESEFRILAIGMGADEHHAFVDAIAANPAMKLQSAYDDDLLRAGATMFAWAPDVVVLDFSLGYNASLKMALAVREIVPQTNLLALVGDDLGDKKYTDLAERGFDDGFRRPLSWPKIAGHLAELAEAKWNGPADRPKLIQRTQG